MLSLFAGISRKKVWDFQRVCGFGNWRVCEAAAEEEEGIGGFQLTIASQTLIPIVALLVR